MNQVTSSGNLGSRSIVLGGAVVVAFAASLLPFITFWPAAAVTLGACVISGIGSKRSRQ